MQLLMLRASATAGNFYARAGDGSTTGGAGDVTHLLPVGTYKYFCSGSADGSTHFHQCADSQATGTFTV
jgi:hypothetical protein